MTFKKIKLQSLLIVFVLFLLLGVFAFLFFRKGEFITVVVKVGEPNYIYQTWRKNPNNGDVSDWFSQLIKVGMEEHDGVGRGVAVVTKVFRYDSSPDMSNTYVTVKIKTTYSRGSGQYTFKGKPVLVGSEIKLYLNNLLINGTITDVVTKEESQKYSTIMVKADLLPQNDWTNRFNNTSGVPPYLAGALKIGDTVYDSQDRPIIKVVDITITDAKTDVMTNDGRVVIQTNPLLKDISYTLELLTTNVGGKYYILGNIPIMVGQEIPIQTKTTAVYPVVTNFINVK